ncbi:FecR domain-containing protein [Sphingobacterium sp.]|uniref:FecR family protein n=1 Tax=Sphingobacterium sp. TaxID=341027 RepID=UPI00289E7F2A|nr:FecR domain-containing protein [Sphingobacterium sp.]
MNTYDKRELFKRFLAGKCREDEAAWLLEQFSENELMETWNEYIDEQFQEVSLEEEVLPVYRKISARELERIEARVFPQEKINSSRPLYLRWTATAAIVMIIGYFSFLHIRTTQDTDQLDESIIVLQDSMVFTESNIAMTLPDGSQVELSDAQEHLDLYVAETDSNGIAQYRIKDREDDLPYIQQIAVPSQKVAAIVLSDGSKVWINSNSKLKYDANFVGPEREVFLEGEAYFEVAHDSEKPFVVVSKGQKIKVLGTRFNVNSYLSNCTTTSLMAGAIMISTEQMDRKLAAGEVCQVNVQGRISLLPRSAAAADGWRKNDFVFNDSKLSDIASALSQWYGINIYVDKHIADSSFSGVISRTKTLADVLDILKRTKQIRFQYHIQHNERSVRLMK